MKRATSLLTVILLYLGCTVPDDIRPLEKSIYFRGVSEQPLTRTSMSGNTASFTTGDRIGVFELKTNRNNVLYTYATPNWTTVAPMYWLNATTPHQFYAYYPYQVTSSGQNITIPVLATQAISSIPDPTRDLLVTQKLQNKVSAVNLNFTHAFALLKFNISFLSGVLSLITPGTMTVNGGNATGGTALYGMFNTVNTLGSVSYNVTAQQLTTGVNDNTVFQQSIVFSIPALFSGATTVYVLVLPGTYTNPAPNVRFTAKLILTGVTLNFSSSSLKVTTFQPNTVYEYNVSFTSLNLTRSQDLQNSIQLTLTPVENNF